MTNFSLETYFKENIPFFYFSFCWINRKLLTKERITRILLNNRISKTEKISIKFPEKNYLVKKDNLKIFLYHISLAWQLKAISLNMLSLSYRISIWLIRLTSRCAITCKWCDRRTCHVRAWYFTRAIRITAEGF